MGNLSNREDGEGHMGAGVWTNMREAELNKENLDALLDNRLPAIRIRTFAAPEECAQFARATALVGLEYYSVAKKIGFIGMAQYEYRWGRPKQDYFDQVRTAYAKQGRVFTESFDVLQRFISLLTPYSEAGVCMASELQGDYFGGIIREASEGVDLHADFAPFNSPDYRIAEIDAQLGWNFYAEGPLNGGETTVYNAPWNPIFGEDEIPQSYNLDDGIVAGAQSYTFSPEVGDVVIFNSRNPHRVADGNAAAGHNRITLGSFIGRMPSRELVLWS